MISTLAAEDRLSLVVHQEMRSISWYNAIIATTLANTSQIIASWAGAESITLRIIVTDEELAPLLPIETD